MCKALQEAVGSMKEAHGGSLRSSRGQRSARTRRERPGLGSDYIRGSNRQLIHWLFPRHSDVRVIAVQEGGGGTQDWSEVWSEFWSPCLLLSHPQVDFLSLSLSCLWFKDGGRGVTSFSSGQMRHPSITVMSSSLGARGPLRQQRPKYDKSTLQRESVS